MEKEQIIQEIQDEIKLLEGLVKAFELLDSADASTQRLATNRIALTTFEMVDSITKTEANIYNFMKGRE